MSFSSFAIFIFFSSAASVSVGPKADLTLSNGPVAPDGFTRSAVLVNGQVPGPLIVGNKGDEFNLNVIDKLTESSMSTSTSIHWHGFFQKGSSWADGAASVTQCPISPGNSFLYTFSSAEQAGTFWYHSHLSTQYCDGLRGVSVLFTSQSTVITLADCTLGPVPTLISTLINGLDTDPLTFQPTSQLAVIKVTFGRRYRFRLVSLSCDPNFIFTIDGHSMTIIEVDGVNHEPHNVDSIQIFAGQRYSFVLTADQKKDNYWIRTVANTGTKGFANGINSAILRYDEAPEADPLTVATPSKSALVETDLRPLNGPPVPGKAIAGGADVVLNLAISFDPKARTFAINGVQFKPPTMPVLLQILSGAQSATDLLPSGSVIVLPPNSVIELSIPAGAIPGFPHPFHLHGHTFHVIRSAGNDTFNFVNPVIRDVVSTGSAATDNTTIRFITDNAGPHIDFHLEAGLAIIFAEDTPTVAKSTQPPAWKDLCPKPATSS
ncbi:laccase [Mycena rebaudengoi]|nr:laccase [Mycena rebaudengoi]